MCLCDERRRPAAGCCDSEPNLQSSSVYIPLALLSVSRHFQDLQATTRRVRSHVSECVYVCVYVCVCHRSRSSDNMKVDMEPRSARLSKVDNTIS